MNILQTLTLEKQSLSQRQGSNGNTYTELAGAFAIWVLVAQWLERFTGYQKATDSIRLGLRNRFSEVMTWRTFISKFGQSLLVLQKCIIAVGKSKFWNLCCLGIIVCIWTMASLSFPAVEIVSWFWSIFDLISFKLSSWLNAELVLVGWIGWFSTTWIVLDFSTTELIRPSFFVFCYCFSAPLGYSRAQCLCPLNCSYL